MTLKELYNARRDEVADVLHNYLCKSAEYRLKHSFEDYVNDLEVCPVCSEINEKDNMTYHKWDIGNIEEMICESCRNDEEA